MVTTLTWPTDVPPDPITDGFQYVQAENRITFGTEIGPGKRRRRTTARSHFIDCTYLLTDDQRGALELFFENDTHDGTLPFLLFDHVKRDIPEMMFESQISYTLAGAWETPENPYWLAKFRLRRMP